MDNLTMPIHIRWADIDANRHLRHSVYYDFAAAMRMNILSAKGLTTAKLEEFQIGPILFREEAIFRKEIKLEDRIVIDVHMVKSTEDYGRVGLRHHFLKEDRAVATILNVDFAWMDLVKRKLTAPNEFIRSIFAALPKADDFQWVTPSKK